MSALMQFEDFAATRLAPAAQFSANDLAQQYQLGLTEGAAQAQDRWMDQLSAQLQDAMAAAGTEAEIRRQAISDTMAAVVPLLKSLTQKLAALPSDSLIDHLATELETLCQAGVAPTCRLSGRIELIERLTARIAELGLTGVTILPGPHTEITFDGGRITLDPQDINSQINAFLAELQASLED